MPAAAVETVLGPVSADELGHTQLHEHVLCDLTRKTTPGYQVPEGPEQITLWNYYQVRREHPPVNLRLLDRDVAVTELELYRARGGVTLVDATSIGLGRDPEGLREVSHRAGVNIVMGSGYYCHAYHPPELAEASLAEIASSIVDDLTVGVAGSGIKAGLIGEIGLFWPIHPVEETVLRAAVTAQRETGAGLLIHPGHHELAPQAALDIVSAAGGRPEAAVIAHLDRTMFSSESLLRLAGTGCYLEFDLFGQEMSYYPFKPVDRPVYLPTDATRVDYIVDLVAHGHLEQVIVSQDVCNKTSLRTYGGEGYSHILDHVVPLMREKGLTEEQIRTITVDNPRRALLP